MKIQVLMSTYNGAKYIDEQIKSILHQRDVEVSLLIRDDGSIDTTPNILRKWEETDNRIHVVYEKNIGVKRSFLKLVQMSTPSYDYYAFSDQDDIWLYDKLKTAAKRLSIEQNDIPLIYGSSVFLYCDNAIVGKQFNCPDLYLGNFLIKNYYPGCTMVFNGVLRELVNTVDYNILCERPLHDHWLNLVCTACGGKVLMDMKPCIMYRQHSANAIGDRTILQKIKGNGLLTRSHNTRLQICQELHDLYEKYEDEESKNLIKCVINYQSGFSYKLKLALNKKIKPLSFIEKIAIFLIVLMGKY